MNTPLDPLQRHKTQVIATAFGINLVFGILMVTMYPGMMNPETSRATFDVLGNSMLLMTYQFLSWIIILVWMALDARQLDVRPPWWLKVGAVLVPLVFIPYYLFKTRPSGLRSTAILMFFAILLGGSFVMAIGMFCAVLQIGPPAASGIPA